MKTLYLVRHAKSSWADNYHEDSQRPLIKEGIKRTNKVISYLLTKNVRPDIIISSHAIRAYETSRLIADGLSVPVSHIKVDDNLYYYDEERLYNSIFGFSDEAQSIMIVGHNPTMTQMANRFLETKMDFLPTSTVVCIEFNTKSWGEVPLAEFNVPWIVSPKLFEQS